MCTMVGHNEPVDGYFVAAPVSNVAELSLSGRAGDVGAPDVLDLGG